MKTTVTKRLRTILSWSPAGEGFRRLAIALGTSTLIWRLWIAGNAMQAGHFTRTAHFNSRGTEVSAAYIAQLRRGATTFSVDPANDAKRLIAQMMLDEFTVENRVEWDTVAWLALSLPLLFAFSAWAATTGVGWVIMGFRPRE